MSTNIGDIAVRVGADIEPLQQGMKRAGQSVKGFDADVNRSGAVAKRFAAGIAGAGVAVVGAMAAMTSAAMTNLDAMTKQARAAGTTTAAFQAMSMVAKEAGVSGGQLSNVLSTMQRQMVDLERGSAAATRTFGNLNLSLSDLQNLAPDKQFELIASRLNAIEDPALRTATAMEVFGKAGRDAINMLDGYSDKIRDAEQFQRRFGIAISETDAAQIERANDAVARLGMAFSGLGNTLAVVAAPAMERFSNRALEFAGNVATRVNPPTDTLLGLLGDLPGKMDAARDAEPGLSGALANLGIIASETATELGTVAGWLDEIARKWQENQALGAPIKMMTGPGGGPMFTPEGGSLEDYLSNPPPINPGRPDVRTPDGTTIRPRSAPAMLGEPAGGRGGGGGRAVPSIGGGAEVASQMAERLAALQEGLMSEAEVIDEWYSGSLQTLEEARAQELLTEEEYWDAKAKLQEEYTRRSQELMREELQARQQTFSMMSALLSQFGSRNKIAAKAAVALNAAQRVSEISANTAAAATRALAELGPIAGPPAAARITAYGMVQKGIAAASAALQMGGGGSSGGGGSFAGSGASGAQQAPAPSQRIRFEIVGSGEGADAAFRALQLVQQAIDSGGRLDGIIAERASA
jgi:hypothetical protein